MDEEGAPWVTTSFSDARMVAMPFPAIDPVFSSSMEGAGDLAIVVSDRPEVRALIRAMASVMGVWWVQANSTFLSPHQGFDLDSYADPDDRARAVALRDAIEAGTFRFDASDQLPDASAEDTLASVEATWVKYEASLDG